MGCHPLHLHLCYRENSRGLWNRSWHSKSSCLSNTPTWMSFGALCWVYSPKIVFLNLSQPNSFPLCFSFLFFFFLDVYVRSRQNKPKNKGVVQWLFQRVGFSGHCYLLYWFWIEIGWGRGLRPRANGLLPQHHLLVCPPLGHPGCQPAGWTVCHDDRQDGEYVDLDFYQLRFFYWWEALTECRTTAKHIVL